MNKVILGTETQPLMVLEKYPISQSSFSFKEAHNELHVYLTKNKNTSHTWGYFPGLEKNESTKYSACIQLAHDLDTQLISKNQSLAPYVFKLAFIRIASAKPISEFGGMHIDVDIGVGHSKDKNHEKDEIIRLLLNPYHHPRTLHYVPLTRAELQKRGVEIPTNYYTKLNLPSSIPVHSIDIPPMEKDAIWGLRFCSSLIPHAGITYDKGHFLIAYGAWVSDHNLAN